MPILHAEKQAGEDGDDEALRPPRPRWPMLSHWRIRATSWRSLRRSSIGR